MGLLFNFIIQKLKKPKYFAPLNYLTYLHCRLFLGSSVIVWKQTDRIISAGEVLLRKDSRMSLIKSSNGFNLQLANVTPDDRGKLKME